MSLFKRTAEPAPPAGGDGQLQRAPILDPGVPQSTNRYVLVGVWKQATDVEGRAYQTGAVDRMARCFVELSGGRRAERGEVIEATPGEAEVLSKRFVLSMEA